jgi:hypothetical protein
VVKKMVVIDGCSDCPSHTGPDYEIYVIRCAKLRRTFDVRKGIPDNCPLDDAPMDMAMLSVEVSIENTDEEV